MHRWIPTSPYVSTLHIKVQGFLLFIFLPEEERVVSATVEVIRTLFESNQIKFFADKPS